MHIKVTQRQQHAQQQANYSLFETAQQAEQRRARAAPLQKAPTVIAYVQDRVTASECREWSTVKARAANSGAYRVEGWEGMNWAAENTFGAEAGTLRNVARCDADGVCL